MTALTEETGRALVIAARAALHDALGAESIPVPKAALIDEPGASFVTLRQHGELRGCIGSVEPTRPLVEDVCRNAVAAAFRDPRFWRMEPHELAHTRIEVTVLGVPEEIAARTEDEALRNIEAGVDGVILTVGGRRGVFLPQVWEQLEDAAEFLSHLKTKAGLPPAGWPAGLKLERFRVQKWREENPVEHEALS